MSTSSSGSDICSWSISGEIPRSGSVDMDNNKVFRNVWGTDEAFLSPTEWSGSLAASLESEESSEDCEGYISGLAEEIAQSMLEEEDSAADKEASKSGSALNFPWGCYKMSASPPSPQSTLAVLNWETQSNRGSSGVPSPRSPQEAEAADLLYGDLLRMKIEGEVDGASKQRRSCSIPHQVIHKPTAYVVPEAGRPGSKSTSSSSRKQRPGDYQRGRDNVLGMAIDRAMMAKQERNQRSRGGSADAGAQSAGNQATSRGRKGSGGGGGGGGGRPARGCEQQQQHHFSSVGGGNVSGCARKEVGGEGLRAVFLGVPTSPSRQCGGTGVFLPRRHPNPRRKPACSTVLLPPHIVQALNLSVEDTLPMSQRRDSFAASSDRHRTMSNRAGIEGVQGSSHPLLIPRSTTLQEVAPNICLPSEWTY